MNQKFRSVLCLFFLTVLPACGEIGEQLNAARLEQDEAKWSNLAPADYNLEWQSTSARNQSIYRVYVRDGKVQSVRLFRPDGKEIALKPAEPEFYSIPGIFKTIREEIAQSRESKPFGQPAGTTVVLTIRNDPKWGFPVLYRRDIFGVDERMGINVTRFEPTSTEIPSADKPR